MVGVSICSPTIDDRNGVTTDTLQSSASLGIVNAPMLVAASLALAGLGTALHLGLSPDRFAASSALVIATGVVLFTIIVTTGLLVARGRWARFVGMGLVAFVLAVLVVTDVSVWSMTAGVAALGALFGLSGRWLSGWIRPRPAATGPGTDAVVVLLGLLALIPAVGVAAPDGLETGHGLLGAAGVLLAWSYAKAQPWAIWAIRFVLPLAAIPAVLASPVAGGVGLALLVAVVMRFAWSEPARLAATPIFDREPGPRIAPRRSEDRP